MLLYAVALAFIAANLSLGLMFFTVAKNQMQAMQMTFFFFLSSLLLSGFMFPFRGMPQWAENFGSVLLLTHLLRMVRSLLLKGGGLLEPLPHLWPIGLFFSDGGDRVEAILEGVGLGEGRIGWGWLQRG